MMKKTSFLIMALVLALGQAWAAPVDEAAARGAAQRFVSSMASPGRLRVALPAGELNLLYAEMSSVMANQASYYIYGIDGSFVIVAGDDRAKEILAYGDGAYNLNDIPCGMQVILNWYKQEMDYLFLNPDVVLGSTMPETLRSVPTSIEPLLTANWNQTEPYYNECPTLNGVPCVTGCSCTSLSMVLYYWKYPAQLTTSVPGYTLSNGVVAEELPPTTFDWDNMLDDYIPGQYTTVQGDAVAHLMRYVGQSEHMNYSPDGSGASDANILATAKNFGYDSNARILTKTTWRGTPIYTDEEWAALLLNELQEGRPLVYTGYCRPNGEVAGHAFNVDGYCADDNTFHVNFGWGGYWNGYYTLNYFGDEDYVFNIFQAMIVGLKPAAHQATVTVEPMQVLLEGMHVGEELTESFTVNGIDLTGDLTLALNDPTGIYSIDKTRITASEATNGATVNVTCSPAAPGTIHATVTISGSGIEPLTVDLIAVVTEAIVGDPVIVVDKTEVDFGDTYNGYGKNMSIFVKGENLTDNLYLRLENNEPEDFFVGRRIITPAEAAEGVNVSLRFFPTGRGSESCHLILTSAGADSVDVKLKGYGIKTGAFLEPSDTALTFESSVGLPVTKTIGVLKTDFDGWLAAFGDFTPIELYSVIGSLEGDDSFSISTLRNYTTDEGNDSVVFAVFYCPRTPGAHHARITFTSATINHPAYPITVELTGWAILIGDLDGDGLLTPDDVAMLTDAIINNDEEILSSPNADVDGDGVIDINDVVMLADMVRNCAYYDE